MLAFVALLACAFWAACDQDIDVHNEADFNKMRDCPDSTFTFRSNIDITQTFAPIPSFIGAIEGNNYQLTIARIMPVAGNMGVFKTFSGTIKNLRITANIEDLDEQTSKAGIFAGECNNKGIIELIVIGSITCTKALAPGMDHYIGGLAGHVLRVGSHIDVRVNIDVKVPSVNLYIGGAMGLLKDTAAPNMQSIAIMRDLMYQGTITVGALRPTVPEIGFASSTPFYVGGIAAKAEMTIMGCLATKIDVNIWASTLDLVYGGLVGQQTKSIVSSFVTAASATIKNSGKFSRIGGFVGSFQSGCPTCATIESSRAIYTQFHTHADGASTGGFVGYSLRGNLTRCLASYENISIVAPGGGFMGIGEAVHICESAFKATNFTITGESNFGAGGFAAEIRSSSLINNSYIIVTNMTMAAPGVKRGHFTGSIIDSGVDNSFVQNINATLVIKTSTNTKIGFFSGNLQYKEAKAYISHSYSKISKYSYTMQANHILDFGGFVTEVWTSDLNVQAMPVSINSCWMDVSLYADFTQSPTDSRTCIVGLTDLARSGVVVKNFYGRFHIESNFISFARANCFCVASQLILFTSAIFDHVILNLTYNYIGDASQTPRDIYVFGISGDCSDCKELIVAHNRYLYKNQNHIYDPELMRSASFYTSRGWTLAEDADWTSMNSETVPVLTALPYILRPYQFSKPNSLYINGSSITSMAYTIDTPVDDSDDVGSEGYHFYFPVCQLTSCWDYDKVWNSTKPTGHGELIWVTRECVVKFCAMCKAESKFACELCASGKLSQQGTCQLCSENCISCPESIDTCTKCADTSYEIQNGKCIEANRCLSQENCLLCNTDNRDLCERCERGYWLESMNRHCVKCPDNCHVCNSDTDCIKCAVSEIAPVAGSCDYTFTCVDMKVCLFCKSDFPGFCLVCADNSFVPNESGICVSTDTLYCYIARCTLCVANNPYWCSACEPGSYVSSLYGICMYCEKDCSTCTELECLSCTDTDKQPINGTCFYTADCAIPHCKYCGGLLYKTCLRCDDGYNYNRYTQTCNKQEITSTETIYTVITAIVLIIIAVIFVASCVISLNRVVKKRKLMDNMMALPTDIQESSVAHDTVLLSREIGTPVPITGDSVHDITD